MFDLELSTFLDKNRISKEMWKQSDCTWDQLCEIATHHENRKAELSNTAEFLVKTVQQLPHVHSVRWRIKDTEHVLEKIVRKRSSGAEKYSAISRETYSEKITDLIGLRALHLFKMDCYSIDDTLRTLWQPLEQPTIYVREGDRAPPENILSRGFEVKKHPAGYRSIHYVFSSQPLREQINFELQVRTIFEEGWSEIDHQVRYPNFSDNPLVSYFLTIFNRMAGSADEMGSFVQDLVYTLEKTQAEVENKEDSLRAMEVQIQELAKLKRQDVESQKIIANLQSEINSLRRSPSLDSMIGLGSRALSDRLGLSGLINTTDYLAEESLKRNVLSLGLLTADELSDIESKLRNTDLTLKEEVLKRLNNPSGEALARAMKLID